MHSYQPSRGRILLEFFSALAIVASLVGTWKQTQASALLVAAAATGLLAMIRLFDFGRRPVIEAEEPQRIEFEAPAPEAEEVVAVPEPQAVIKAVVEEVEPVEPPAPRASAGRRKGGSRKGSGRRAKGSDEANVVELVQPAELEPQQADEVEPIPLEDSSLEPEGLDEISMDEMPHAPVVPLFEPEPFARQHRVSFGRKAR